MVARGGGAVAGRPSCSLIVAAVVYFAILKPLEALQGLRKKEEAEAEAAGPSTDELLTEIRDLLRAQSKG